MDGITLRGTGGFCRAENFAPCCRASILHDQGSAVKTLFSERENRRFHRAVAYYAGLSKLCGRELAQTDFGFRGSKAGIFETIQEAYRNQKQQANA